MIRWVGFFRHKDFRWFNLPSSDLGPYLGLLSMDCMVDSRSWKFPYGSGDLSLLPSAESVKSLFRFWNNSFPLIVQSVDNAMTSSRK